MAIQRSPENKNKLVVDTEVAEVIKLIFNLYEQGNRCYENSSDIK